ncbi:hypothetical protein TNIN_267291 [Trichonephila inaurata madagascariensis]|uniref:Uncharacterized protein n=1 Tax=Trichonephila inaurata madagascariensis TaxID=2747483 RepID=A0A8X6MDQ9_9ARAC|nr:hypothetical protein TNIN_267291 [Trichonephila inaurata madagascariensis]
MLNQVSGTNNSDKPTSHAPVNIIGRASFVLNDACLFFGKNWVLEFLGTERMISRTIGSSEIFLSATSTDFSFGISSSIVRRTGGLGSLTICRYLRINWLNSLAFASSE